MKEIRLIDANALKEELLKDKYISWDCEYAVTHEDIKRVIDNAPTVDVKGEKIIRCIDCKYYHPFKHWCDCHGDWAGGEDGFCSLAKMKGGEEE